MTAGAPRKGIMNAGSRRIDRDRDPESCHSVLALVTFDVLIAGRNRGRDAGTVAFSALHEGEGWLIPEEVRLESHDLGHRARAEDTQSVATYLHPLFLDWPLAQATEDSWAACEQYVWVCLGVALFDARCAKSGKPTHTSASVGAERRADRQPAGRRRNYFN